MSGHFPPHFGRSRRSALAGAVIGSARWPRRPRQTHSRRRRCRRRRRAEAPPTGASPCGDPGAQPVADARAAADRWAPPVPQIANQQYGQGISRGPLGSLRDAWHMAQNPTLHAAHAARRYPQQTVRAPAGRRSGDSAATRIPVADRPGVQRSVPERDSYGGGPPSAGVGYLPAHRAAASPATSIRRPTRMCGSRSTRMRCRRPGPSHRGPEAPTDQRQRGDDLALEQLDAGRSYAASGK